MTGDGHTYKLTASVYKRLRARGFSFVCKFCGQEIKVGEMVYVFDFRRGRHGCRVHLACLEKSRLG